MNRSRRRQGGGGGSAAWWGLGPPLDAFGLTFPSASRPQYWFVAVPHAILIWVYDEMRKLFIRLYPGSKCRVIFETLLIHFDKLPISNLLFLPLQAGGIRTCIIKTTSLPSQDSNQQTGDFLSIVWPLAQTDVTAAGVIRMHVGEGGRPCERHSQMFCTLEQIFNCVHIIFISISISLF